MAGFKIKDEYFVPRSHLELPYDINWYMVRFLPRIQIWRHQAASRDGDKSECCKNFLNGLLPYLVRVLIQDSIYFVNDFPNHEIARFIKVSTTGVYLNATRFIQLVIYYRTTYLGTNSGQRTLGSGCQTG